MNKPTPYIFPKIIPIIGYAEKTILGLLAIVLITYFYTGNYFYIVQASILLFIPTYILIAFHTFNFYAYERKIEVKVFSEEESDDSEIEIQSGNILFEIILPKVLWLSNAVTLSGVFFFTMHTGNSGYMQGLITGGFSICIGLIVFLITYIKKEKIYKELGFILLRSIPILLVDLYILF